MKISEQDEILISYVNNLNDRALQKNAADWVDIVNALGLEALTGAAVSAAWAALTGTTGAFGLGTAALGGAGLLGLGPVGAVLAAAGVAYTVYSVMQHTDDNLDDLIKRLEALDTNDKSDDVVNGWINNLKQFGNVFKLEMPSNNPSERAEQINRQIETITKLLNYLKQIQSFWPQVKSNLTDWGFDDGQAEVAINKTTKAVEDGLLQIKQEAQKEGTKLVQQLGKQTGVDYQNIAKQVINLHNQITQMDGSPPEYEEYEKPAFHLAQNIIAGKAELQDINQFGPQMKSLLKGLQSALYRAQKKTKKRSSMKNISKRAVRLSSETKQVSKDTIPKSGPKPKDETKNVNVSVGKDPKIQMLQKSLNYLNLNLKTGIGRIAEDGDYGQNTINSLNALLEKVPVIETYLARGAGIDKESISDANFMKQNPDYLNGLVGIISALANKIRPKQENKEYETQYTGQSQCREDKENPMPEEILACLRSRQVQDPQTEQYNTAYEYLKQKGMRDNDIVALVVRLFRGARSEDWDYKALVRHVSGPRFDVARGY